MPTEPETTVPSHPKETDLGTLDAYTYHFKKGDWVAERYQVLTPLGFGGFAQVYHCRDTQLNRDVSVKVLIKKTVGLGEAQAAAPLKHPHIVSVYDVVTPKDSPPFIIFEYVAGETLEDCLKKTEHQRLPLNEKSLRIIRQISMALDYAHTQGVIHQDVKPSNIILDHQGNAFLTDFGLAKIKLPDGQSVHTEYFHRLSGTFPYIAPEILRGGGRPADEHSDLYSLGVVAYDMLKGQPPYAELPQSIETVLIKALDKNPDKRYDSCESFVKALENAHQAYQAANDKYEQARKHMELGRWRLALPILESLDQQTPNFKDAARYLEQARLQDQLSQLYQKARQAVSEEKYQDALNILQNLTEKSSNYDVFDVQQQAQEGFAREKKRQLKQQYQEAKRLFREGRYQTCLDTLDTIREQDPNYPCSKELVKNVQEQVNLQQQHRQHYNQGVEHMNQKQWDQALEIFQNLQSKVPGYEDVDTRLAMARHMARLSSLLQQAQEFLDQGNPALCLEKLEKLQGIDGKYRREQVAALKGKAQSQQQNALRQTCPKCGYNRHGPQLRGTCRNCGAELLLGDDQVLKDRYQVVQVLGHGSMGAVYQSQDTKQDQIVAIKELCDKTQFEYELGMLQSLDHSQLPQIYDHFEHKDRLYLVMEFIAGRSLADIIDENVDAGRLQRWHIVRGWGIELCNVLEYLHGQRIIHRDIKPANVRLNTRGEIVLVDLGTAQCLSSAQTEEKPKDAKLAQEGESIPEDRCTVGYAAVEQILSGYAPPDERADIYSLGATLYAVLTNQVPPTSLARHQQEKQLCPLQDINPDVPDHLAQAIERAMALQPEDRFSSIQEMRLALSFAKPTTNEPERDILPSYQSVWCLCFNDQPLKTLQDTAIIIGRSFEQTDAPDLNLAQFPELPKSDLKTVSREHCLIAREGAFYITDLKSRNGTWLNGKKLTPKRPYLIKSGDQFKLGKVTFKFEVIKVKSDVIKRQQLSPMVWRLRSQNQALEQVTRSEVIIGRSYLQTNSPDLNLAQYTDLPQEIKTVSRQHCHISCIEKKFYIKDLGSRNGTWLNEEQLEPQTHHPIQNGDHIRLGKLTLEFEIIDPDISLESDKRRLH